MNATRHGPLSLTTLYGRLCVDGVDGGGVISGAVTMSVAGLAQAVIGDRGVDRRRGPQ